MKIAELPLKKPTPSTRTSRLAARLALLAVGLALQSPAAQDITISRTAVVPGNTPPILLNLSGITGEAAQVLQFDLYVQGFAFTNAEAAQYLISGSANGNLTAQAVDRINKTTKVPNKAYTGSTLRRQAHAFVDDFVTSLQRKPIAMTRIAYKNDTGQNSEIYVSDFDGFNPQEVTRDDTIVAAPTWMPGRRALYYTSYKLNKRPSIFYHDLDTGSRNVVARYGGSNLSPAVSPDGKQLAMILSKDGWTDLYVAERDGTNPKRLTRSPQDESSPCWSPDGRWICFAAKIRERRSLCRISPGGGEPQRIDTVGVSNPTEPDWSPDGEWIVFTAMMGGSFEICVVPAKGGSVTELVAGEDPSWAPNSRTVVFARRQGGRRTLSLLDVPTKQVKDVSRISGSSSQPSWAR